MQFVLPKGITVANAPEPLDARVMLREIPPQRVAAIRYAGFWSESNYNEYLDKLQCCFGTLRHPAAVTPLGHTLNDYGAQRNRSNEGKAQRRSIRAEFRQRRIEVEVGAVLMFLWW